MQDATHERTDEVSKDSTYNEELPTMDEQRHATSLCLNISIVCILHSHCLEGTCVCQ